MCRRRTHMQAFEELYSLGYRCRWLQAVCACSCHPLRLSLPKSWARLGRVATWGIGASMMAGSVGGLFAWSGTSGCTRLRRFGGLPLVFFRLLLPFPKAAACSVDHPPPHSRQLHSFATGVHQHLSVCSLPIVGTPCFKSYMPSK